MSGPWWETRHTRKSGEAESSAAKARREAGEDARSLRRSVDRLVLLNRALWELLAEASGLDEARLEEKVKEIELRDAAAEGPTGGARTRTCVSCGRALLHGHRRCSWCGAVDASPDPFDVAS